MSRLSLRILAGLVLALTAACSPAAAPAQSPPPPSPTTRPANTATPEPAARPTPEPDLDARVASAVMGFLEQAYGLAADQVQVQSVEAVQWRDSCLGVNLPGSPCLQVITPGYRLTLDTPLGAFIFHTDERAASLRLASGPSGIEGQALLGPACPVAASDTDCPDHPYATTLTILGPGDLAVAVIETDAEGRFKLPLPPGRYTLVPQSGEPLPVASPLTVTVPPDGYAQVQVLYDSGIR